MDELGPGVGSPAAEADLAAAFCLLAYINVAVAMQRQHDASSGLDAGLIPVTVPELVRLLRGTVIPPPRRDRARRLHWPAWRRRHQHHAR